MRRTIFGSLILAAAATQAHADAAVDLSQYSCAGLDTAAAPDIAQLSQVIKGTATEWRAFFTTDGGTRRLKCITITRPDARTLSRDQAAAFLAAAQGQSTAAASRAAAAPASTPAAETQPYVRPEPLKAKPATVGTVSATAPLAASQDVGAASAAKAPAAAALDAPLAPALAASLTGSSRAPVDHSAGPFKSIGYLLTTFPNGDTVRCTGSIISDYAVLTAGSCLHNAARGGYAVAATFYAGQYEATPGDGKPIRPIVAKSDVASFRTTQRWTEISGNATLSVADHAYNMGAVLFKTPYREGKQNLDGTVFDGSYTLRVWQTNTFGAAWVSGYPSGVDGKVNLSQYAGEGNETQDSIDKYDYITHTHELALPATPGDVGAPMYFNDTLFNTGDILGLVTYADEKGAVLGGPSFDFWNGSLINDWQNWKPPVEPGPTEAVSDLHVASIFSSSQPTSQSYLRFHNAGAAAGHVTVDLKNPTTGDTIASWTSADIQGGSEVQVFIDEIERTAFTTGTKPQNYAMSVKPTFEGYFQHVLWQRADNSLTNLTSCDSGVMNDPKTLVAVHSSLLQSGYPSTVVVYNSGSAAADISLGMFDARNGQRLGTYHVGVVQPGGQAIANVPAMEQAASPKITPSGTMYHYVIAADTAFTGYLQHIVQNTGDGVLTDMSIVCRLKPVQ